VYEPRSNTAGHFYHEKSGSRVSLSIKLCLVDLWAAGAPLQSFYFCFQAFSIFSQAKDEDGRKKRLLLDFFSQSEDCLKTLDDKLVQLLQQNIYEEMETRQVQLKQREYFLLVAGKYGILDILYVRKAVLNNKHKM